MPDPSRPPGPLDALSAEVAAERRAALHAIHALEYALAAPAPRRQRTWLHRVASAIDALSAALQAHLPHDDSVHLLDEIALAHPEHVQRIERIREELLDLTVAVASIREQIETDLTREIDPTEIRERLATVTKRFRRHQADQADLVFETIGIDLDDAAS